MSADALEARLGHTFADRGLYARSLTHPSAAHEEDGSRGNERLEFLGDAVLDLIISRVLFERHPDWHEGMLTRARARLVNKDSLAARAREIDLGAAIRLGKTEHQSRGHEKDSVLANAFEAVVGAFYLDAGLDRVSEFVTAHFAALLEESDVAAADPKTAFQEWSHAHENATPRYTMLEDRGDEGGDERFRVAVEVLGDVRAEGVGRTKRAAERVAAATALANAEGSQ